MLQIRKTKSRSDPACRSLFQLLQPLSYETLDFERLEDIQTDRALTRARRHFSIQLMEVMQFVMLFFVRNSKLFCFIAVLAQGVFQNTQIAFSPSVAFTFFVLAAFGARHMFCFCNTSRMRRSFLHMLVANVLLALRFFTSGIDLQLVEYALAISNGKPRMILTVFTCTRFCNAMLLPPKRQQHFFSTASLLANQKRASRARGVEKLGFLVPALGAVHIFLSSPPCVGMRFLVFSTPPMESCMFCLK